MKKRTNNTPLINERGQSLILALLIMFLLVFLGGVFVALIARNLSRTQRSSETLTSDYLAEAGIRYAGDQLTYSEDGADWRPVPSFPSVFGLPGAPPNPLDPDFEWLMKGFCRFTYGKGRFLLRVTYNPRPYDPLSKYIKIESVGRVGIVDIEDPTTWQTRQSSRLRAEKIAYKAIGITDYSRFITNKDRRPDQFSLGAPGFNTQFGDFLDVSNKGVVDIGISKIDPADPATWQAYSEAYGGSIRVNGDLLWHGVNDVWVNPLRNEGVEVAGDIHFDVYNPDPAADATRVMVNLVNATRSADPNFNTLLTTITGVDPPDSGLYRDGRTGTDFWGNPRNIVRLDPPLIDVRGPAGGVSRYRELTRNSGEWVNGPTGWFNRGFYGWGAGLYINNPNDKQSETELGTLKNEWMTPGSSQYWLGPYYIPPGVMIVLTPHDLDGKDTDGDGNSDEKDVILIRTDATPTNPVWFDRDGNPMTTTGGQMIMPYPRNGVIFAEGNVRIKGTLPAETQLTVVSGGTIYVEGSILRYPYDEDGDLLAPDAARDSAIALLATDNVCVNTTQFFGPMAEGLLPVNWRPDLASFIASVSQPLYLNWAFGADAPTTYTDGTNPLPICVYTRHTAAGTDVPCYMNMTINEAGQWWGLYPFGLGAAWNPAPPLPNRDYIYPLADLMAAPTFPVQILPAKYAQAIAEQKWPMWEHQTFTVFGPGSPVANFTFRTDPGTYNSIGFHLDQNFARGDYLLSRMAVQPCDIRIEALMYAQNGSFFVIPGEWFNPDTNDISLDAGSLDANSNLIPDYRDKDWKRQRIDERWPFYGQPLDCRITILGAISENVPASIAEVGAWMEKWGWIPPVHGCSTQVVDQTIEYRKPLNPNDSDTDIYRGGDPKQPIKQRGLTIVYDSALSYPRKADLTPVRTDAYLRVLPLLPKLPVSPETLYFGSPT